VGIGGRRPSLAYPALHGLSFIYFPSCQIPDLNKPELDMRVKDKYLIPFTDFGFKKLFGTESNKDILIDFLNELLHRDEEKIKDITYLSSEQLGRIIEWKTVLDIYCKNAQGEKFIVDDAAGQAELF